MLWRFWLVIFKTGRGWLAGWMAGWLDGWMAGWLDGWLWQGWLGSWLERPLLVPSRLASSRLRSSLLLPGLWTAMPWTGMPAAPSPDGVVRWDRVLLCVPKGKTRGVGAREGEGGVRTARSNRVEGWMSRKSSPTRKEESGTRSFFFCPSCPFWVSSDPLLPLLSSRVSSARHGARGVLRAALACLVWPVRRAAAPPFFVLLASSPRLLFCSLSGPIRPLHALLHFFPRSSSPSPPRSTTPSHDVSVLGPPLGPKSCLVQRAPPPETD